AEGATFGAGTFRLGANAQVSAMLNQSPFYFANSGVSLDQARSFTFSSSLPVGAIALRGHTNERSDFLMTTLPVAPATGSTNETVVVPHFADGGGWRTQVLLVNPTDQAISGTVEIGSLLGYSIAPRSAAKIV